MNDTHILYVTVNSSCGGLAFIFKVHLSQDIPHIIMLLKDLYNFQIPTASCHDIVKFQDAASDKDSVVCCAML